MSSPFDRLPDLLLDFGRPGWLAVGALAAAVVLLIAMAGAALRTTRWRLALALRVGAIALCAMALSDPRIELRSRDLAVVLVRDVSASVPEASLRALEAWLDATRAPADERETLGEVLIGAQAVPSRLPAPSPLGQPSLVGVDREGSDIESALRLALALPRTGGLRVLLASDGNATIGDPLAAADALAAQGVPIDVLALPADRDPWVSIDAFRLPARAAEGRPIRARVELRASRPIAGRLLVRRIGPTPEVASIAVELERGVDAVALTLPAGLESIAGYEARFEADDPEIERRLDPRTTVARAFVPIDGPARVLVVDGRAGDGTAIRAALDTPDLDVEAATAAQLPSTPDGFARYDLVLLVGVAFDEIGPAASTALVRAVEDLGVGLLVVAGRDGFAPGWLGTPLAEILPVDLALPEGRIPQGSLAIAIDSSGSMAESVGATTRNKQSIANEAAAQAVARLSERDLVAIIAFSGSARVVAPLAPRGSAAQLAERIGRIAPGGGTDVFSAIDASAREVLSGPPGPHRVVLLTDGNSSGDHDAGLARVGAMARAGVAVSTIGIGDDVNVELLRAIAVRGGGRFHHLRGNRIESALAEVLREEALSIRRPPIREGGPFQPIPLGPFVAAGGSLDLPPLAGYGVVSPRGRDAVVAIRVDEDPILASWNRGIGRVVAFTADASGPWTEAWRAWSEFAGFWRRETRWAGRPALGSAEISVSPLSAAEAGSRGGDALVTLRLADPQRRVASIDARLWSPEGSQALELAPQGFGVFRAPLDLGAADAGIVAARVRFEDGETAVIRASAARSRPREWAGRPTDDALLARIAERTGGERLSLDQPRTDLFDRTNVRFPGSLGIAWPVFAALAALLFLADVAIRRLVGWQRDGAATMPTRPARPAPPTVAPVAVDSGTAAEPARDPSLGRLIGAKRRAGQRDASGSS